MKKKKKKNKKLLPGSKSWANLMKMVPKLKVTEKSRQKFKKGSKTKKKPPKIQGVEISSYWNRFD